MLELIPKDTEVIKCGGYIFEIAPDGVNIRKKVSDKPLTSEDIINMADWLQVVAGIAEEKWETKTDGQSV